MANPVSLYSEPKTAAVLRNPDADVLVVGGKPSNFDQELRENPRLIFWDSTNNDWKRKGVVPDKVRLILFTRFHNTAARERIRRQAKARKILVVNTLLNSGQISNTFDSPSFTPRVKESARRADGVLDFSVQTGRAATVSVSSEENNVVTKRTCNKKGSVKKFMKDHALVEATDVAVEAERLRKLGFALGIKLSPAAAKVAFYRFRCAHRLHVAKPAPDARTSGANAVPGHVKELEDFLVEALRLIREAGEHVSLGIDLAQTFGESGENAILEKLVAENRRLKEENAKLVQFREQVQQLIGAVKK